MRRADIRPCSGMHKEASVWTGHGAGFLAILFTPAGSGDSLQEASLTVMAPLAPPRTDERAGRSKGICRNAAIGHFL